jgi:hypothetical protein
VRPEDAAQLIHLGDRVVARTAHAFGAGSPQEDRVRAAVGRANRAVKHGDREAIDAALDEIDRLIVEFDLDAEFEDILGEEPS